MLKDKHNKHEIKYNELVTKYENVMKEKMLIKLDKERFGQKISMHKRTIAKMQEELADK